MGNKKFLTEIKSKADFVLNVFSLSTSHQIVRRLKIQMHRDCRNGV